MTESLLASRHRSVFKRSFERHMDLFLTAHYLQLGHLSDVNADTYREFTPTAEHWANYLRSHQAPGLKDTVGAYTIGDLDVAIKAWWAGQKDVLDGYRTVHQERALCIPLAEFKSLFAKSSDELVCAYCRISETEFEQLRAKGLVYTKRLRTRGTSFELDCRVPALGYAADNVVVCCYWCNNAKSDEFSPKEFMPVAQALERAWRGRLSTKQASA